MKPRLLFSELSDRVYVVTRYTEKPHPTLPGRGIIVASTKYDVTEDFEEVASRRPRKKRAKPAPAAPPSPPGTGEGETPDV